MAASGFEHSRERTLIEALCIRVQGRHPEEPLTWRRKLIESWGYRGHAKLTTKAFQYWALPHERGESVRIELQQMAEVHLRRGVLWFLVIYIRDRDDRWYTFRLDTFGGWQRRFREVARDATFRLFDGTPKGNHASP
jgi:hypothetical protein